MLKALPFLLATAMLATAATPGAPVYRVAESIAVPDGGWDYARVDPETHRLYVARTASVTVIDLRSNTVGSIGAIERGHAALPLAGHHLLVTSGNDATVRILDESNGNELARIPVGKKPDAALYDPANDRAYVMNAADGTVSVIDVAAMRVSSTIQLKPGLEYAAIAGDGRLYVNNEDEGEIEVVDLASGDVAKPIALPGCEEPSGMGYDANYNRLISACANGKAAIVDLGQQKLSALVDIGIGPDAVMIDSARGLAFIPCGKDGVLDILSLASPDSVARVSRVQTEVGARTGALDPASGAIYLPAARFGPPAQAGGRPVAIPGTAHILVVRPS